MSLQERGILGLPTELLQHICSLVDVYTLPNVRLTCRTLATAAFDSFASEFLTELVCFFPDPARVARLLNILSDRALVKKVQRVKFTVDALECREQYLTHVNSSSENAAGSYKRAFPYGRMYQAEPLKHFFSQQWDVINLTNNLRRLDATKSNFTIAVCTQLYLRENFDLTDHIHILLTAILEAKFSVHNLSLVADGNLRSEFLSSSKAEYCSIAMGLRQLSYHIPSYVSGSGQVYPERAVQGVCSLLASTLHLESLTFKFIHDLRPESPLVSTGTKFLNACRATSLRELDISLLLLPDFERLFEILRRCHDTLETIALVELMDASEQNLWPTLFEILRSIPKLRSLVLKKLYVGRSFSAPLQVYENCTCHEGLHHPLDYDLTGNVAIAASLSRALQNGTVLRSVPRDMMVRRRMLRLNV